MLDHLWEADPDIILVLDPHHRCALTLSDILPGTDEDRLPDKWKWQAHTRHFYLQMGVSEPEHQICTSHDDPLEKLLKLLASLEQPNGFHFSKHPHQTWKVVKFCWLHGSNEHCNTKLLAQEMMKHSQFRPLRDKGASLMLVWDFIAISPHEQIDWRDRVYCMHVEVQEPH